jgi:transcriptional regulator with XRE-family HTH domain
MGIIQERSQEQAKVLKNVGLRFREARELNNLQLTTAAKKLGYQNGSKLSKIENASDTLSIPTYILVRAAKLYGVSMDYLFGLTEDWDGDPLNRLQNQFLIETMEKLRLRDMAVLAQLSVKVDAVATTIEHVSRTAIEVEVALDRFRTMHPEFEEMRASRLVNAVQNAADAGRNARSSLVRFRLNCSMASVDTHQLSLQLN